MSSILDTKYMHPRDQVALIMSRVYKRGLTTSTGGNISIMDENGDIWITPAAIDKGSLRPSDIMQVKKDGTIIGPHRPSSELPFHRAMYKTRPDIKAIIHAHPPALVTFSIVRKTPDTHMIAEAFKVCGKIGYAIYDVPGSEALGKRIAEEFTKGVWAVIMENHGTVVGGTDLADTFQRFETMEFCAQSILSGSALGPCKNPTEAELLSLKEKNNILPEAEVIHSTDEKDKRIKICDLVHRCCDQGIMMSAFGTVSMRLSGEDFLITPTGKSRWDLTIEDMVQISGGKREKGKYPSQAAALHSQIYKTHPEINAIIMAESPNLMAFSLSGAKFDVRTIPESWIFLQDVPIIPFSSLEEPEKISGLLNKNNPALIVKNAFALMTGNSLTQAFDRLEVAEFSAKSIVMGVHIGQMVPINDDQVEDLRKVFLS